jgi:hypothetical protein
MHVFHSNCFVVLCGDGMLQHHATCAYSCDEDMVRAVLSGRAVHYTLVRVWAV